MNLSGSKLRSSTNFKISKFKFSHFEMVQFVASLRFRDSNFKCQYLETCLIFSVTHHFLSTIPHPLSLMLDLFITVPSESLQYW